jgi:hypothetical protein
MDKFALGKLDHKQDDRTMMLANFLAVPPTVTVPKADDFDKGRRPFPLQTWGNDMWGNCVEVGMHNQSVRQYRFETHYSLQISERMVVKAYQDESEREFGHRPESPGDQFDNGLVMLYAIRNWRSLGLTVPKPSGAGRKPFKIDAFGLLNPDDREQLRAAAYLLTGVLFGISLPLTAYDQISKGQPWEDLGLHNGQSDPGSWGGHCVFSCHYDEGGFYCLTWGRKQYMTNAFIERYADEVWATVDALDAHSRYLDVAKLEQYLRDIGARQMNNG